MNVRTAEHTGVREIWLKYTFLGTFFKNFLLRYFFSKICINSSKCEINLYIFLKIHLTFAPPISCTAAERVFVNDLRCVWPPANREAEQKTAKDN